MASTAPSVKDGSPKRRQRTKGALVAAALRLIDEKGVEGTSVLAITQHLGISNGTFYYHFDNMERLLEEVGHTVVAQLNGHIRRIQHADPAVLVARGPLIILRYAERHPELRAIMLRVILDVEGRHADLHEYLCEKVERGRRVGRFAVENVDLAVQFCRSIVGNGVRQQALASGERVALLTAVHTLALLGLPLWEAHSIVEEQRGLIGDEDLGLAEPTEIFTDASEPTD